MFMLRGYPCIVTRVLIVSEMLSRNRHKKAPKSELFLGDQEIFGLGVDQFSILAQNTEGLFAGIVSRIAQKIFDAKKLVVLGGSIRTTE